MYKIGRGSVLELNLKAKKFLFLQTAHEELETTIIVILTSFVRTDKPGLQNSSKCIFFHNFISIFIQI
jgi:hypothetical protein